MFHENLGILAPHLIIFAGKSNAKSFDTPNLKTPYRKRSMVGVLGICGRLQSSSAKEPPPNGPRHLAGVKHLAGVQYLDWCPTAVTSLTEENRGRRENETAVFFVPHPKKDQSSCLCRGGAGRNFWSANLMFQVKTGIAGITNVVPQARSRKRTGFSTLAVHGGEARQKALDAVTDPIVCSSTYSFTDTQAVIDYIQQDQQREEYGRYGNPGQRVVEKKLAALDGADQALVYASGMAAVVGLLMAKLKQGDEVVFFDQCYHRTREFCKQHLARFGVVTKEVRTGDYVALENAVGARTRLLFSESPTNPHLSVVDVERFVEIGRRRQVETVIDATLATPCNLQPIEFGVDYVVHSATKYLAGHNDVLAGSIAGSKEKLEEVAYLRGITGGVISAHATYLLQRGLKTLQLRMARHNENGLAVARFLEQHPLVQRVYYPGLESHPDYTIASETMNGYGGLVTFELASRDWRDAANVVDRIKLGRIAPSLGGVETLVEQPLVMSYYQATPEDRQRWGISDNMIRLSCGIEDTDDLVADLDQALAQR
jgi:cystathionine gamma-synthase